ncbi:MAG: hypothetical protein ACE141_14870 [Bryobacteraceae bacterium]
METIQFAISNTAYATALRESLARNAGCTIVAVECPDVRAGGVLVLDSAALERIPSKIPSPERVVLITRNEPRLLSKAWEAGIVSVVFENDPIDTAILAIMAARLHAPKSGRGDQAVSTAGPGGGPGRGRH